MCKPTTVSRSTNWAITGVALSGPGAKCHCTVAARVDHTVGFTPRWCLHSQQSPPDAELLNIEKVFRPIRDLNPWPSDPFTLCALKVWCSTDWANRAHPTVLYISPEMATGMVFILWIIHCLSMITEFWKALHWFIPFLAEFKICFSQTGNRTPATAVRAPDPNH